MTNSGGILVPVGPSRTLEETVAHAVELVDTEGGDIHLIKTVPGHHVERDEVSPDQRVLDRAERFANKYSTGAISVRTALLGTEEYIAGPAEHVEFYLEYMNEHELDRILVDPGFSFDATAPTLQSLEELLDELGIEYELADVGDPDWKPTRGELIRGGVIGAAAFGFYVALGGPTYWFAIWSGVVTALLSGILLRNVVFETTPRLRQGVRVFARLGIFVPSLLWEIAKANVQFAYVVLHPRLPIDPHLDRVEGAVGDGKSVMVFANSITLTPGTMAVDADGHHLLIHSLNRSAREDMLDGVHESAVRKLFYGSGRQRMEGPGPREDFEPLYGSSIRDRDSRGSDDSEQEDTQ